MNWPLPAYLQQSDTTKQMLLRYGNCMPSPTPAIMMRATPESHTWEPQFKEMLDSFPDISDDMKTALLGNGVNCRYLFYIMGLGDGVPMKVISELAEVTDSAQGWTHDERQRHKLNIVPSKV